MKILTETKILGFPIWKFAIILVAMFAMAVTDTLLTNMIGALAFAIIVGTFFGWIGDRIPIWNSWFGGGILFTALAAAALNTFKLIGPGTIEALNTFNGKTGFLNLYILVLITGSVLSIDRKVLVKSFVGYIPTIIGGIITAFLLCGALGLLTGVGFLESIMDFAIPIMGGGNGAGIQPMSKMWAAAMGVGDEAASSWWATKFAVISLANILAVFFSAVLNRVGEKMPHLTGNGKLMEYEGEDDSDKLDTVKVGPGDYVTGLALALFCMSIATLWGKHLSFINRAGLGFSIHEFAFMVILVGILNITNLIPLEVRAGARAIQRFFVKYMSFPLMITVGIGSSLADYAKVFTNPANFVCMFGTVVGSMIGTFAIGKLFKFYPVESMITAGLCMANAGGSGDVQCLGAAHRMELMPYAQISSRIGGAIMLIIASFFYGKFAF